MDMKENALHSNRLISTSIIKAVAILFIIVNHTVIYSVSGDQLKMINNRYFLIFWLYQAVSLFIVVTGIHYAKSIEKAEAKENDCLEKGVLSWYKKGSFCKKFLRLWIPYTIEQVVFYLYYVYIRKGTIGKNAFFSYISGGVGPGGYYTICMIQILVIFPIIYYLIKRYKIIGILFIVFFNLLYAFMVKIGRISTSFDRLCSIRLFTGLMLGIVIYLYYNKIKDTVIPWILFVLGAGVLIWNCGGGYQLQFTASWLSSSFAVVPYSAAIVWLVVSKEDKLQLLSKQSSLINRFIKGIEFVGKATYHIFLVQQFYFCLNLYNRTNIRLSQASVIDICACVTAGCIFYTCYNKCQMFFIAKQKRKSREKCV